MNRARTGVVPAAFRAVIGLAVLVAVGVQFAALVLAVGNALRARRSG
jgi:hypothetical protein